MMSETIISLIISSLFFRSLLRNDNAVLTKANRTNFHSRLHRHISSHSFFLQVSIVLRQELPIDVIQQILEYLDDASLVMVAVASGIEVDVTSGPVGCLDIFNNVRSTYIVTQF